MLVVFPIARFGVVHGALLAFLLVLISALRYPLWAWMFGPTGLRVLAASMGFAAAFVLLDDGALRSRMATAKACVRRALNWLFNPEALRLKIPVPGWIPKERRGWRSVFRVVLALALAVPLVLLEIGLWNFDQAVMIVSEKNIPIGIRAVAYFKASAESPTLWALMPSYVFLMMLACVDD
jgi:hypothetical protein